MVKNHAISIYLDSRRAKENGKFPVKLRVYTSTPRRQKLYPTVFEFSEKEFESIWLTSKPRKEHKEDRAKLNAVEVKAKEVADKINPFSFDLFEKQLYRKVGDGVRVSYHYNQLIKNLHKRKQIGTANSYEYSQKSLMQFVKGTGRGKFDNLTLFDITPDWLKDYEQYLVEDNGKSLTTVGIYLRALRAVFNKAIEEKEIDQDYYPFGKRRYQIPATSNVKKALTKDQLKTLYISTPETPEQLKAKDFWFFSYFCNGMNTKDVAELRFKDIEDGKIHFVRAKTKRTTKAHLKPVTVYLNEFTNHFISQYGNKDTSPENLVFDIISDRQTAIEQHNAISNFNRFLGQHLKRLCKTIGLPEAISPYWARHTFATNSLRKGATMEFMQEAMGHGNKGTTQRYFAGFDDDTKKEFAKSLMDF
jgi:integrase/recombinase XerD